MSLEWNYEISIWYKWIYPFINGIYIYIHIYIHSDPFCTFFVVETPANHRSVTWFKQSCSTTKGEGISTTSAEATRWSGGHWLCFEVGEDSKGGPWLRWIWLEFVESVDVFCWPLLTLCFCWAKRSCAPKKPTTRFQKKLLGGQVFWIQKHSCFFPAGEGSAKMWGCGSAKGGCSRDHQDQWPGGGWLALTDGDSWFSCGEFWRARGVECPNGSKRRCGCSCKKNISCSRSLRPGSMAGPQLIMRRTA